MTTALAACRAEETKPPTESFEELVARLAPKRARVTVGFDEEPTSYRVEYDLYVRGHTKGEVGGKSGHRRTLLDASRVVREVVRPFDETGTIRRSLGFVRDVNGDRSRVSLVRPLPDDPRPLVYPPRVRARFGRRIAGRVCAAYELDGDEYCVDNAGIVLLTRSTNSVEVVTKVTLGNQTSTPEELARSRAAGFNDTSLGSMRPVDVETAPEGATDYSLDAPPSGFTHVGRYAVVPLTGEVLKRNSLKVIAGIVDVYVRGSDAVVVERGGKLDLSDVGPEDLGSLFDAHAVELPQLGTGQAGIGGIGPFGYREVRARPKKGRYVVVAGTLPEDQLVSIAGSLRAWPGNGLRFLDR